MANIFSAAVSIGFHGLAFAMVLYLVSVGLSVTMGLMGFVNLAHGVFAAAGGYIATTLMNRYGVPFCLAIALAVVVVGIAAASPLERPLYRRLYGADELDQVLLTIGLVFMSVPAAQILWGPLPQPFHPPAVSARPDRNRRSATSRPIAASSSRSGAVLVTAALARPRAHPFRRADPRRRR